MFINVFIPQLKHHIMHSDYYIKGQAAGTQFALRPSSTAQTSGDEVVVRIKLFHIKNCRLNHTLYPCNLKVQEKGQEAALEQQHW